MTSASGACPEPEDAQSVGGRDNPQDASYNNGESLADEVDFVPNPPQTATQQRAKESSGIVQSGVSSQEPATKGVISRFKLDIRGQENEFKFAPAPRHAPGHFTNRKIVPRIDGPAIQQYSVQQPPPGNGPKVHQVDTTHTSPPRDTAHNRPGPVLSAKPPSHPTPRTVDETQGRSGPSRIIGLPLSKRQPSPITVVDAPTSPDGPEQRQLPDLAQSNGQGSQSHDPNPRTSPPNPEDSCSTEMEVETGSSAQSRPSNCSLQIPPYVMEKMAPMSDRRQTLDTIMEDPEEPELPSHQGGSNHSRRGAKHSESHTYVHVTSSGKLPPTTAMNQPQPKRHKRDQQSARHQINRPLREVYHVREYSRSPSESSSASGASKRRARSIRDLNVFRDRDLPEVANKVNDLWRLCNDAVKEAEAESQKKAEKYRKKLSERSQKIATYLETMDIQARAIQTLEDEKRDMRSCIVRMESEMRSQTEKIPELRDRCQALKETLGSAMKEQQEQHQLHARYMKSTQEAIDEIRAEKQREQSARELVERQLAAVREQMKERVRQVELHSQEECRRMSEMIQALSRQVEDKDSQANREREMNDKLSDELKQHQSTQGFLKELRDQSLEIVKMLGDRQDQDIAGPMMVAQEEFRVKVELMTENLGSLREQLLPQSEVVSTLSYKQEEAVSRFASTLETISESQGRTEVSMKQLGADLRGCVDDMWQHLDSREDALTQQLAEKRTENAMLTRVLEEEKQSLESQIREAEEKCVKHEERIGELVRKIEELELQPRADPELESLSNAMAKENDTLRSELAARDDKVSVLENQLAAKTESYRVEVEKFGRETSRLAQVMNDREHSTKSMADKTQEFLRKEFQAKLERIQTEAQERVQHAETERLAIVNELIEARKKLAEIGQDGTNMPCAVKTLQPAFEAADHRLNMLNEELRQKQSELQGCQERDAATIMALKANLAMTQKQASDMTAAHKTEVEKAKTLLSNLWKWVESRSGAHGFKSELDGLWKASEPAGAIGKRWPVFLESVVCRIDEYRGHSQTTQLSQAASQRGSGANNPGAQGVLGSGAPTASYRGEQVEPSAQGTNGSAPQQSFNLRPVNPAVEMSDVSSTLARRVMVQSPHPGVLTPVPMSVEQEKTRRRGGAQPKPIMKRVTRSHAMSEMPQISSEDFGAASSQFSNHGSLPHPPYPGLLTGSLSADDGKGGKLTPDQARADSSSRGQNVLEVQLPEARNRAEANVIKIKLKTPKRARNTGVQTAEPLLSPIQPEQGHDPIVDDGDETQAKRAKLQKTSSIGSSTRGKGPGQTKKQKTATVARRMSGVVHGSFTPGVVQGASQPPETKST